MTRAILVVRLISILLLLFTLLGCGSGAAKRNRARDRAIAATRLTREAFAVAGLGRKVTRADKKPRSGRISLFSSTLRSSRDAAPGYDEDLKLFYDLVLNLDGSGRQNLYTDVALTKPAGNFTWPPPEWSGGQSGVYPVIFRPSFVINGGEHAGVSGGMAITLNDSSGENGHIHLDLYDSRGGHSVADFDLKNGKISGKQQCSLDDGITYEEIDTYRDDGSMICEMTFSDGSRETLEMWADGNMEETYYDPEGNVDGSADLNEDGVGDFTWDDGTEDIIDVDTGEEWDSGSSGDDRHAARIRRPTARSRAGAGHIRR